ncbi:MAG TPA: hypothetical protein PLN93_12700, partial [Vicinamibacterales bacterium]|nr:hypothetical protein [Vicinamibacterales bacterium]
PDAFAGADIGIDDKADVIDATRLILALRRGDPRRGLADHVLARFDGDERDEVDRAVARAADAVETFLAAGIEAAMNRHNRAEDPASS